MWLNTKRQMIQSKWGGVCHRTSCRTSGDKKDPLDSAVTQRVEGRDLGLRMVELRGFQAAGLGSLCWRPQEQGPASLGPSLASGVPSLMLLIAAVLWTGGKPGVFGLCGIVTAGPGREWEKRQFN